MRNNIEDILDCGDIGPQLPPAPSHLPRATTPLFSQARHIISRFGGARSLCRALALIGVYRNPATVYKWMYPRGVKNGQGGTGGIIPASIWPSILKAAHIDGIVLNASDFAIKRASIE